VVLLARPHGLNVLAAQPASNKVATEGYPAGYPGRSLGAATISALVSRCLSATGIRFLGILFPQGIGLPSRSAYRPVVGHTDVAPDPDGVSMFRTRETRLRLGALYTPGTAVSTRPFKVHDRRLPHHNDKVPVCPPLPPDADSSADEASARVSG
jgi:hypothetical protein